MAPSPAQVLAAVKASGVRYELCAKWNDSSIDAGGNWAPSYVILHHTANGGANGNAPSLNYCLKGTFPPVRNCHFLVGRDGLVYVLTAFKCYHAGLGGPGKWGNGSSVAKDSMNGAAYGIEIESKGTSTSLAGNNGYTVAQVEATAKLTKALLAMMGKSAGCAINHRTWAGPRKTDTLYADSWWQPRIIAAGKGDDDMPLTDAEIDKIATAVWKKAIASMWDGTNKPASVMLAQTNFYAIQGGILGTTPATATSNAGKRTALGQVYDESVIDGGGGGGAGASADEIADELAQRLEE